MHTVTVATHAKEPVIDITEEVNVELRDAAHEQGVCVIFAAHTTCALTTADLDPGTDRDLLQALCSILPEQSYRHPHDPAHTPDHILSSLLGPSLAIPFQGRRLLLGTWQRVVLVELDGPRQRLVQIACLA
jgi:secondary thiamine-phosphate synthase enzyme